MALRYIFTGDEPNRFEVWTDGVIAFDGAGSEVYPQPFHITELRNLTVFDVNNGITFIEIQTTRREVLLAAQNHGYTLQEYDDQILKNTRHTAPRVTTYLPVRGGTTTSLTQNIVLTFSENIARATATGPFVQLINKTTNTVIETFQFDSTAITLATTTATINPTSALVDENEYALLVSTGYFTNVGATAIHGGIASQNFYTFTAGA